MLLPRGHRQAKGDLLALENALRDRSDSGLRTVIESWIKQTEKKLADATRKDS